MVKSVVLLPEYRDVDVTSPKDHPEWNVGEFAVCSLQIVRESRGSGSTDPTFTLKISNDRRHWVTHPANSTLSLTNGSIAGPFDTSAYLWIRLEIATASGYADDRFSFILVGAK